MSQQDNVEYWQTVSNETPINERGRYVEAIKRYEQHKANIEAELARRRGARKPRCTCGPTDYIGHANDCPVEKAQRAVDVAVDMALNNVSHALHLNGEQLDTLASLIDAKIAAALLKDDGK